MTTTPLVIAPADRSRAIAALTLAFVDDPVVRWVYPGPEEYVTSWPLFVDAFGGRAFERGTAHGTGDMAAIALWLPPGVAPDEEAMFALLYGRADDRVRNEIDRVLEQMGDFHPPVEHWYLPLIGVDPVAQGRGLGSALLEHALATCDRDAVPAYLEATSPRSRALYVRHGFEEIGVIQAGSSPPMWPMFRTPR